VISDFRQKADAILHFSWLYAVSSGNSIPTFWDNLSVSQ